MSSLSRLVRGRALAVLTLVGAGALIGLLSPAGAGVAFAQAPDTLPARTSPAQATASAASPAEGTYELSEVEEKPEAVNRREITRLLQQHYPASLRDAGTAGEVTMKFRVGRDGRVDPESIEVLSSTHAEFRAAARMVAAQMRFRPARVNSQPVAAWVAIPLNFRVAYP